MTIPWLSIPLTLTAEGRDQAIDYLRSYFAPRTTTSGYSGSRFERLGGGGDRTAVASELTPEDLVAVSLLSVDVPGAAALAILEDRQDLLSSLLGKIPTNRHLADVDPPEIVNTWPAWRLESELLSIYGLGPTTVSKLIARKRPLLVPVYDTLVAGLLKPIGGYWAALNAELRRNDSALQRHLISLRAEAGIGDDISPLRVFDVVAWRTAKDELSGGRHADLPLA